MASSSERTRRGLQACLLYLLLATGPAQAETYPPRNDALEAPGFKAFYGHLVRAINRKDANFIRSITDEASFVGSDVRNARAKPDWDNPNSTWWTLLGWAVDLGGVHHAGTPFSFPTPLPRECAIPSRTG